MTDMTTKKIGYLTGYEDMDIVDGKLVRRPSKKSTVSSQTYLTYCITMALRRHSVVMGRAMYYAGVR
jgi:hypothetical protein